MLVRRVENCAGCAVETTTREREQADGKLVAMTGDGTTLAFFRDVYPLVVTSILRLPVRDTMPPTLAELTWGPPTRRSSHASNRTLQSCTPRMRTCPFQWTW